MTIKFKRPARYDVSLADEGVWFALEDEAGNSWGEFKLRYLDPLSPRTEATYKRIRAKYAPQIKSKKMGDLEAAKVAFIEANLADWRGIEDEKGKAVEFSLENAMAYFDTETDEGRWALVQLGNLAGDVTNFGATPVEHTEKN